MAEVDFWQERIQNNEWIFETGVMRVSVWVSVSRRERSRARGCCTLITSNAQISKNRYPEDSFTDVWGTGEVDARIYITLITFIIQTLAWCAAREKRRKKCQKMHVCWKSETSNPGCTSLSRQSVPFYVCQLFFNGVVNTIVNLCGLSSIINAYRSKWRTAFKSFSHNSKQIRQRENIIWFTGSLVVMSTRLM